MVHKNKKDKKEEIDKPINAPVCPYCGRALKSIQSRIYVSYFVYYKYYLINDRLEHREIEDETNCQSWDMEPEEYLCPYCGGELKIPKGKVEDFLKGKFFLYKGQED
ncbi:MAG: hypothetical protein ACP5T9_03115 [Thermoplasmata archaeon]